MTTVSENIKAGKYETELPFPRFNDKHLSKDEKIAMNRARRLDQGRLNKLFEEDLAIEHGVFEHPKRSKLFELAWVQGHSSGFHEVDMYYGEFVELLT